MSRHVVTSASAFGLWISGLWVLGCIKDEVFGLRVSGLEFGVLSRARARQYRCKFSVRKTNVAFLCGQRIKCNVNPSSRNVGVMRCWSYIEISSYNSI